MDGSCGPLGRIERHFWLTRSVARVMGISLSDCMAEGLLSESGYGELITRCRASGCDTICEAWLATQTDRAERAPAHCANAEILDRLRPPARPGRHGD
ncbi:MAG: hypothetical protein KDK02_04530 [Rhodobacteraceae bacterium]|nr:hypothetical protein [Paracoccaceae bacterium]